MKLTPALMATATAALLAACGGGHDGGSDTPPAADTEVPVSATASTTAYTRYAASLAATETQEPLGVNQVTPPTSETEPPLPL